MPRARSHRLRVKCQISRNQLHEFIYNAVTERDITLDDARISIIQTILDNMPRPLDRIYLPRWCHNFVRPYLAQFTDRMPECRDICEAVRKELLVILYGHTLSQLAACALNAKTRINTNWIRRHYRPIFRIITKQFRTSEGNVDWQFVADRIGISHIFSFTVFERRNLQTAIQQLTALLCSEKPEGFNGKWIRDRNPRLFEHLAVNYRTPENLPDWPRIIALLNPQWRVRWKYRQLARGKTLKLAMEALLALLDKMSPKEFGPRWVEVHAPYAYRFFRYHVRTPEGAINWQVLCDLLPNVWQQRWRYRTYSFPQAIALLKELLNTHRPLEFNARWIRMHDCGLLTQICRHVRTADHSAIDWQRVIQELDPVWRAKWHPRRMDVMASVEEYEDMSEVEAILSQYREQLYLFFGAENRGDRVRRDTICHALVRLAQKGNVDAKDTLITYATFTMNDWIDRIPYLAPFHTVPNVSTERLEKCIRGYQFWDNGTPFFGYLYASLIAEVKKIRVDSLDKLCYPHDSNNDDTLYNRISNDRVLFSQSTAEYTAS